MPSVERSSRSARIGDAERDACVDRLTAAMVRGQLSEPEFQDRCDIAVRAFTQNELDGLTADLDDADSSLPSPRPAGLVITQRDASKAAVYVGVTGVLLLYIWGYMGDEMLQGLLLWIFALVCGGVGALLGRSSDGR